MQKTTIPEGYKADSRGRLVPIESIKPIDLERDSLVIELVTRAARLASLLALLRVDALKDINAFVDLSAEKYGAKLGGAKGNVTLVSFDGRYKVTLDVDEYMAFDERLNAAKALVDECLREWTTDAGAEIRTLINNAFQVDKKGKINTARILELRNLNIEHPTWKRAMEAISDSLTIAGSRRYVRFYTRIGETDKYQQIALDLANAQITATPEEDAK